MTDDWPKCRARLVGIGEEDFSGLEPLYADIRAALQRVEGLEFDLNHECAELLKQQCDNAALRQRVEELERENEYQRLALNACPDPQFDFTLKRWLCGCTEKAGGINHGSSDGWLELVDPGDELLRRRAEAAEARARQLERENTDLRRENGHITRQLCDHLVEIECANAKLKNAQDQMAEIAASNADHVRWHREAEAKLTKVVEIVEDMEDTDPDDGTAWFHDRCRAALAAVKGE